MNLEGHELSDEYIVTAERIFEFCGADSSSTLCVDKLMDTFAPFVKTNKAEYSNLRSLLDPHQSNPEITVSKLAATLSKYSESQKTKVDLDESFNTKSGLIPHDSDSGISSDGFQLLEELQCELREKAQVLHQLRRQLDDCEAQHEEALASAAAERSALLEQLNMLREENGSLNHVRRDYEDVCERLSVGERTLEEAREQLEGARKRARDLADKVELLETEKQSLTELLCRSKAECHRINEKYASRQSALLERDESLRRERAELQAVADREQRQLQRQLQRMQAEKILLEMELKDVLNKSDAQLRLERSVDVSYTDEQILSALDSLNSDSRFTQEPASVSTQTELPCTECVRRVPQRGLRRYLWDSLKWLFQVFAVVCFVCAVWMLCGVTGRVRPCPPRCPPAAAASPWWWMHAHELLDLFLTIEYVAEVPM